MSTFPLGTRNFVNRRSSTTTSPSTRSTPEAATWRASARMPASGLGGVRIALPSEFASVWSKEVNSTFPARLVRPPRVRSPLATSTRSPRSVPSARAARAGGSAS